MKITNTYHTNTIPVPYQYLPYQYNHTNIFFILQLLGFGISVLEGIDPNAENFVSAGILHTRNQQVGVLVRLEPNKQAQVSINYLCSALFLASLYESALRAVALSLALGLGSVCADNLDPLVQSIVG